MGSTFGKTISTPAELAAAKTFVTGVLAEATAAKRVLLFAETGWNPYCSRAQAALVTIVKPEQITRMTMDGQPDVSKSAVQDVMEEITGKRTIPRVFVAGECIGGGAETKAMAASGELKKLLEANGIPTI